MGWSLGSDVMCCPACYAIGKLSAGDSHMGMAASSGRNSDP